MKAQFVVNEFRNPSGEVVYRVYGRKNTGEVVRQNFKLYVQALARKQELEIEALNSPLVLTMQPTRLTVEQVRDAEAAIFRLKGTGHSLVECVDYFLKTWKPALKERTLAQAFKEFMAEKTSANLRPDTLRNLRDRVGRFVRKCQDKNVSEVQIGDVRDAINVAGWSPTMRSNERRAVHSFFAWAVGQGYCHENPVAKVQSPIIERGEPRVLTLAEALVFMRTARDYKDGALLPFIVLSLFSGARPTELRRISWDDINLENKLMTVRGAAAKLRQRRLVELSDNLVEWLVACRGRPVFDKNFRRNFDAVRRASGYKGSYPKKGDEDLKQWVSDLFRHTSLSFHFAYNRHEGQTAEWGGTSVVMLHKHYKGLVCWADAERYWSIAPGSLDDVNDKIVVPLKPAVAA